MNNRFILTDTQQVLLRQNSHVASCSARMVQYTASFKRHALQARNQGMRPSDIFREVGIPIELFAKRYAHQRLLAWERIARTSGSTRFDQEQRGKVGAAALARLRDRERAYAAMDDKQKIAFLETENELLSHIRKRFQLPRPMQRPSRSSRPRRNTRSSP